METTGLEGVKKWIGVLGALQQAPRYVTVCLFSFFFSLFYTTNACDLFRNYLHTLMGTTEGVRDSAAVEAMTPAALSLLSSAAAVVRYSFY